MTSVLVGLLVGNVAPLKPQPPMLKSACVYNLCLNTPVMDLMTLITTNPYWLRNVCVGLYMPFVMLEWLSPKARFLFMLLSSLFIVQQMNSGPSQKKLFYSLFYPGYPRHQGNCNLKIACSTLRYYRVACTILSNCPLNETWWGC